MASVSFRNSEPNRVSLKTSQNETHRGQFGHFALTIYKHFALHKSRRTLIISIHQFFTNIFSQFSLNSHRSKPQTTLFYFLFLRACYFRSIPRHKSSKVEQRSVNVTRSPKKHKTNRN